MKLQTEVPAENFLTGTNKIPKVGASLFMTGISGNPFYGNENILISNDIKAKLDGNVSLGGIGLGGKVETSLTSGKTNYEGGFVFGVDSKINAGIVNKTTTIIKTDEINISGD